MLPCAPQVLDGGIYEQVKDYLVSLSQMELEAYQAVHDTFNVVLESSNAVRAWKLAHILALIELGCYQICLCRLADS